jgi:integrase/recombinase XerD
VKSYSATENFSSLVQDFFCQRLVSQQNVSSQTVAAYRDAFRLFFQFTRRHANRKPSEVTIDDFETDNVLRFLQYLEEERHNCPRTRNARLAALRSFIEFAASKNPAYVGVCQRLLAIPMKRFDLPQLQFLTKQEIVAIIDNTDQGTLSGRRDHVMFTVLYNTGARVSELIGILIQDIRLDAHPSVRLHGKGRKERSVPLWTSTARALSVWIKELPKDQTSPVFPDTRGDAISRSGVEYRLRLAVKHASLGLTSLTGKRISPHTIRHTAAMHLLESGVDITVIALWLGHESIQTTHRYIEADMQMKRRAIEMLGEPGEKRIHSRTEDPLLQFLNSL